MTHWLRKINIEKIHLKILKRVIRPKLKVINGVNEIQPLFPEHIKILKWKHYYGFDIYGISTHQIGKKLNFMVGRKY